MCGRFIAPDNISLMLKKYNIMKKGVMINPGGKTFLPSMLVPVVIYDESAEQNRIMEMKWGWMFKGRSQLLINARSESLFNNKIYHNLINKNRCIIPANAFYEWDVEKNKFIIKVKGSKIISLAGLYNVFLDNSPIESVVIITKEADEQLKTIHQRMPLILDDEGQRQWLSYRIFNKENFEDIFLGNIFKLEVSQEDKYRQVNFFNEL